MSPSTKVTTMKKAAPALPNPSTEAGRLSASKPEALDPSEITLVLLDSPATTFEPLPNDFAPTRPLPESVEPSKLPEYRSPEVPGSATFAIPIKDLRQAEMAEAAPTPKAETLPEVGNEPQDTVRMPKPLQPPAPARRSSGSSWLLWVSLGTCLFFAAAGAAVWYLWPRFHSMAKERALVAGNLGSPAEPEAVPPELRAYMDQAKAGDAKAMHMLALMYWNGLNVRQDRVKGLEWYHKAAAAGSTAAQESLKAIEGK